MPRIRGNIFIEAPVEVVSTLGFDLSTWHQWTPNLVSAQADGSFPEVGSKVALNYRVAGVPITMNLTLDQYVPGERVEFKFTGPADGTNTWEYTSKDDGAQVTCTMQFEVPGGGFGEGIYKGLVEKILVENMGETLENLAAVAEQRHRDSVSA